LAWLFFYIFLLIIFLLGSIILKLFKKKLITQSKIIVFLKVAFVAPFLFFYVSSNILDIFPDLKKIVAKPSKYQHINIVNDTKLEHSFLVLKKPYLKSEWKLCNNLNTHINYTKIININPKQTMHLLFEVDTNEFNRIAICKITKSIDFPHHSIFIQVPDLKYILFTSEFVKNSKSKIIRKNYLEDWLSFSYNLTFLLLLVFVILHFSIQSKWNYFIIPVLVLISIAIGFLVYNDIIYFLKIYKII